MLRLIVVATVLLAGCGDSLDCDLGGLTGTWRFSYHERNGNCGALPDETVIFGGSGESDCVSNLSRLSTDRCELEEDFTCPLDVGTLRWTIHWRQLSETHVSGSGTIRVDHPELVCTSTYDIDARRL